jgi:hypothetical protein
MVDPPVLSAIATLRVDEKLVPLGGLKVGVATVADVVVLWNQSKDAVTAAALLGVAL